MVIVRKEKESDQFASENVTREAFWNLYVPGANEHFLLHEARKSVDFVPDLCLVAEENGEIIGCIVYTEALIRTKSNTEEKVLTFGPVSVAPNAQGKGVGSKLITSSIQIAKQMGYKAIVILGYPFYYEKFGFVNGKLKDISMSDGSYPKALQVLELHPGSLDGISGSYYESSVFAVNEQDAENFDKEFFAPKEKFCTESQKAFQIALTLQWNDNYPSDEFKMQCRSTCKISK